MKGSTSLVVESKIHIWKARYEVIALSFLKFWFCSKVQFNTLGICSQSVGDNLSPNKYLQWEIYIVNHQVALKTKYASLYNRRA